MKPESMQTPKIHPPATSVTLVVRPRELMKQAPAHVANPENLARWVQHTVKIASVDHTSPYLSNPVAWIAQTQIILLKVLLTAPSASVISTTLFRRLFA